MNDSTKNDSSTENDDLFSFETDHLALKGNPEYSELLKTIFTLEAQRQRAISDYNKVIELQKKVEENPHEMVEKLSRNEPLGVPDMQTIVEVPKINWAKFNVKIPEHLLRSLHTSEDQEGGGLRGEDLKNKAPSNTRSKPWTVEEQKRLEELLMQYPPEDVELRRFKKIALALGTRTVKQVCSRVQKYFLKLRKAGLPVPGRIPKLVSRKSIHKHQQSNYHNIKPSTFFPELNIPVMMNEGEDIPGPSQGAYHSSESSAYASQSSSTNYLLNTNYHEDRHVELDKSDAELQLNILKHIKVEKERESIEGAVLFLHIGYQCDYCDEDPITGSRWHCITCQASSVDFCTDCMLSQMYSSNRHPLNHKFLIVRDEETSISTDMSSVPTTEYSSDVSYDVNSDVDSDSFYTESLDWIKQEPHTDEDKSPKVRLNGSHGRKAGKKAKVDTSVVKVEYSGHNVLYTDDDDDDDDSDE